MLRGGAAQRRLKNNAAPSPRSNMSTVVFLVSTQEQSQELVQQLAQIKQDASSADAAAAWVAPHRALVESDQLAPLLQTLATELELFLAAPGEFERVLSQRPSVRCACPAAAAAAFFFFFFFFCVLLFAPLSFCRGGVWPAAQPDEHRRTLAPLAPLCCGLMRVIQSVVRRAVAC